MARRKRMHAKKRHPSAFKHGSGINRMRDRLKKMGIFDKLKNQTGEMQEKIQDA